MKRRSEQVPPPIYVADVPDGTTKFAKRELKKLGDATLKFLATTSGEVPFSYRGETRPLLAARTISALYRVLSFPVRRPRGIMEGQNFEFLIREITGIVRPKKEKQLFKSFRISAAGSDSPDMQRLRSRLSSELGLMDDPEDGELLIRMRPSVIVPGGWEVLVRLTPRPLSVRIWRSVDYAGALDGPLAQIMVLMTQPKESDRFLNLMSGSGTLMIERLLIKDTALCIGGDNSVRALSAAQTNIRSAGFQRKSHLLSLDARRTPFSDASFDVVVVDLPWGERVGKRRDLPELYVETMREVARVAAPDARVIVISQAEDHLFAATDSLVEEFEVMEVMRVSQGGYHPSIVELGRKPLSRTVQEVQPPKKRTSPRKHR